jgi:hypothetical protein
VQPTSRLVKDADGEFWLMVGSDLTPCNARNLSRLRWNQNRDTCSFGADLFAADIPTLDEEQTGVVRGLYERLAVSEQPTQQMRAFRLGLDDKADGLGGGQGGSGM